jgi:hypothetical protein
MKSVSCQPAHGKSAWGGARAGTRGGGRVGSPRWERIAATTSAWTVVAERLTHSDVGHRAASTSAEDAECTTGMLGILGVRSGDEKMGKRCTCE